MDSHHESVASEGIPPHDERLWFVMTSPEPKAVEEGLLRENDIRRNEGRDVFRFFIPYQFLEKRIAAEKAFDEEDREDPRSMASIHENNSFRAALKRYIFIRSDEKDLNVLLTDVHTRDCFRNLWWLRGKDKKRITVPSAEMEQFINACCDMHLKFEVCPALPELKKNEKVKLNIDEFKGREAWVLDVRQVYGRTELTCDFYILQETAMLKIRHLGLEDVILRPDKSLSARESNDYRVLEDIQRKLFIVMEHRLCMSGLTDAVRRKDAVTLEKLDSYRYREFGTLSLQSKHCALMLLCMHLTGDRQGKKQFADRARSLLDEIGMKSEDKRPKDVTAWLHFALYMSSGDPSSYEKLRDYLDSSPVKKGVRAAFSIFLDTASVSL